MAEKSTAAVLWENNPDTPINSTNLSKAIDHQPSLKFVYLVNTDADYMQWAGGFDYVINTVWPLGSSPDFKDIYVGKYVYNKATFEVRQGLINNNVKSWSANQPSPYRKLLKILAHSRIQMRYIAVSDSQPVYVDFDSGETDQVFSVDDLLIDADFSPNKFYYIYLYQLYNYGDKAAVKIVSADRDNLSIWTQGSSNILSPTGYNTVCYRKIGGFTTDSLGYITEDSLWDLATYKDELTTSKLKTRAGDAVRLFNSSDIPIVDTQNQFNATDVETALVETRSILDNLRNSFYTNGRIGVELKFSKARKTTGGLLPIADNSNLITLKITAGVIDVFGTRVTLNDDVYFTSSDFSLSINGGTPKRASDGLALADKIIDTQGSDIKVYEGIWRVYIDSGKQIYVKHQTVGVPRWIPQLYGWYDGGNRCIGKFKVSKLGNIYWVDKLSVTTTLDTNMPTNVVFTFHGMMCPDGTLQCDGKWHDITGQDLDSYTLNNVPSISAWGNKWYEETPMMMGETNISGRSIMMKSYTINNTGGEFSMTPDVNGFAPGGSAYCGESSGVDSHTHTLVHDHGPGTINIVQSQGSDHPHTLTFVGGASTTKQINEALPGQSVGAGDHVHTILVTAGRHSHPNTDVIGNTSQLSGSSAATSQTTSWSPYKEVLFCIKK